MLAYPTVQPLGWFPSGETALPQHFVEQNSETAVTLVPLCLG